MLRDEVRRFAAEGVKPIVNKMDEKECFPTEAVFFMVHMDLETVILIAGRIQ